MLHTIGNDNNNFPVPYFNNSKMHNFPPHFRISEIRMGCNQCHVVTGRTFFLNGTQNNSVSSISGVC